MKAYKLAFPLLAALLPLAMARADNKTTTRSQTTKSKIVVPPEVQRPQPPKVNPNKPVVPDKPKKEWPHGKSADKIHVPSPKTTKP